MQQQSPKIDRSEREERYQPYIVSAIVLMTSFGLTILLFKFSGSMSEIRRIIPLIPVFGILLTTTLFVLLRRETETNSQLRDTAEELADAKSNLAALLEIEKSARQQAEYISEARDDFVSIISHEIRTPLNAITGWSSVLGNELVGEKMKRKAAKRINENARLQSEILDKLTEFLQINDESSPLQTNKIECERLISAVADKVRPAAKRKGVKFFEERDLSERVIYCDKKKISNALINLLQNAIKFTPSGGEVRFCARKTNKHLDLTIKDSGLGISEENLPKIFEGFSQADSSTTRRYGGLGLGLAITKEIVILHGGEIGVSSDGVDRGTQFNIRLPFGSQIPVN